jgi:hypothetical protein
VSAETEAITLGNDSFEFGDDEFSLLSKAYKEAETTLNTAKVVRTFSRESNSKNDYQIIADALRIQNIPFHDYVVQKKGSVIS